MVFVIHIVLRSVSLLMMLVIQSDQHLLSTHTILKGYSISCPISCVSVLQVEFSFLSCLSFSMSFFFSSEQMFYMHKVSWFYLIDIIPIYINRRLKSL